MPVASRFYTSGIEMLHAPLIRYSSNCLPPSGVLFLSKILARDFIFLIIPFNLNGVTDVVWLKVVFSKKRRNANVGKHFLWVPGLLGKKSRSYYIRNN